MRLRSPGKPPPPRRLRPASRATNPHRVSNGQRSEPWASLSERDSIDDEVAVFERFDDQPPAAAQRYVLHDRKSPCAPLPVARRDIFAFGNLLSQFDRERLEVITKMNPSHSIHDCDPDLDLPRFILFVWHAWLAPRVRLDQAADQDFPDDH